MDEKISTSLILYGLFFLYVCDARIHRLKVEADDRKTIDLTTFGFLKGGYLSVNVTSFVFFPSDLEKLKNKTFGFTLDKTVSTGISPYLESRAEDCILRDEKIQNDQSISIIFFRLDFTTPNNPFIKVERKGSDLKNTEISILSQDEISRRYSTSSRRRRSSELSRDSLLVSGMKYNENPFRKRRASYENGNNQSKSRIDPLKPTTSSLPLTAQTNRQVNLKAETDWKLVKDRIEITKDPSTNVYRFHFAVKIQNESEEGLYNLFFHNCANFGKKADHRSVNITVYLTEKNVDNYLSAGEIPLPNLYFTLALVNFVLGCVWFYILKRSQEGVFKIHYLMLSLLYVKSIALMFHGLNFHFIRNEGHHEEAFAVLYYITYLMKGTLLFVTILLIGAGWAFIKHILSKREKKIFIIVIPLQILANVAQIIIEETEEGDSQYSTWKEILILVDLLCCGAILFPVVWSIRHLQEASQTDGKAAINLEKLKIFRHFYIMIVCYIYFTRIIVYLLDITVPFQYEWIDELFKELASLVFFIITGYKFRPASNNPYLQLPMSDDEDMEMDTVLAGQSGAVEGLTRVNQVKEEADITKPKQRESSHEYD